MQVCWNRYLPSAEGWSEAVSDTAGAELRAVDSGLDGIGAGGTSSLVNTLSRLGLTALASEGEDEDSDLVAFDFNFLLPAPVRERNGQLQLVIDTEPSLFEPLKELLPQETRDEEVLKLEQQLGDGDNYSVVFKYNMMSKRVGRSLAAHRPLLDALFQAVPMETSAEASLELLEFLDLPDPCSEASDDTSSFDETFSADDEGRECDKQVTDLTFREAAAALLVERASAAGPGAGPDAAEIDSRAEALRLRFEAAAAQEAEHASGFLANVAAAKLASFAQLVNNQPQLVFSAKRTIRGLLAGPNETSIEATYEIPLGPNINRVLKKLQTEAGSDDCAANEATCLEVYAGLANAKRADNTDRLAISVSWTEIGDYTIDRPADGLALSRAGGERLISSLTLGRTFRLAGDEASLSPGRLELNASYENVFDDPDRQDRFVGSLTYTYTVSEGVSIPFGLVYVNKPEFLAMQKVDEELSARLGLKFSLPGSATP